MPPKRATPSGVSPSAVAASVKPSTAFGSPKSTTTTTTTSSSSTTTTTSVTDTLTSATSDIPTIVNNIWTRYLDTTPARTKLIDAFMGFLVVAGGVQFVYCCLVGNYPFNAFLSGFSACVGQFVLAASLRMQTSSSSSSASNKPSSSSSSVPAGGQRFGAGRSDERAFAEFVFGSLVLHFFCINFIN